MKLSLNLGKYVWLYYSNSKQNDKKWICFGTEDEDGRMREQESWFLELNCYLIDAIIHSMNVVNIRQARAK